MPTSTRSKKAAEKFAAAGFTNVRVVDGGILACEACGYTSVNPLYRRVISLERQVRIAAGALVALGVVLGHVVTPYFFLLSLFVGCGLMFSGVTDTCGMALVLARAPWNTKADREASGNDDTAKQG